MKIARWVVYFLLGLIFLFAVHQITAALFRAHNWKGMEASDWASWIQAIFSVLAIVAAIWVMHWQHEKALMLINLEHQRSVTREEEAQRSETKNVLLALRSELGLFPQVIRQRITNPAQIWPAVNLVTPIYDGLAAKLGLVEDDQLRRAVIGAHANLRSYFRMVDDYSAAARLSHETNGENENFERTKQQLWEVLENDGKENLTNLEHTDKLLSKGIEALKNPIT